MAFHILFLCVLIHQSSVSAQASWKKISVTGSYPGRGETAFSQCGGSKLCLLGGRGSNRVHLLDTDTLEWSPGLAHSLEMHHFQGFQGPDECVWVVGAWSGPYPNEATVDNIWRYCPDSNEWFKGDIIPRPRGSGGAFFHNGKVYLVTGNVGGHREGAMVVPWFDSYDPKTGEWEQLPDIPHARDHCQAVVLNNKVYVAGGRRSISKAPEFFDDTVAEVDVYDFDSGTWNTITSLGRPRGGTASAIYNNKVYLIGGEGDNRAWTEVSVLENESFDNGPSLPEPRHGTGVVSCNGVIWIAGGARVLGGGDNAQDTYALFEGIDPPACHYHENEKSIANVTTSFESNTKHGRKSNNLSAGATLAGLPETPASASPEITDPGTVSPMTAIISNPVESSAPKVPSSPELTSDEEQQESISVEVSPDSFPTMEPHESASEDPEDSDDPEAQIVQTQSVSNTPEDISNKASPRKEIGRDPETSRKAPYGAPAPAESAAPVAIESPRPSPMTFEVELVPGSDSSVPDLPSPQANPVPTDPLSSSMVTSLESDSTSLIPSGEMDLQDEFSPEPVGSKDDISLDIGNNISPEATILAEIVPNAEESHLVETEEPQGSNLSIEDGNLIDDLDPSTEFDEETSSCFPSDALVELEDGSTKPMTFLRIGDRVKVAHPDAYSEVFFFSHKHPEKQSKFVQLKTSAEGVSLTLSPEHLLYANGMLVEASKVRTGDKLLLGNEAKSAFVTNISVFKGSGLHHPHTLHGDIVVNNVIASTFTSAIHPIFAKMFLIPFKTAFYVLTNKAHMETLNRFVLHALDTVWWRAGLMPHRW